MLEISKLGKRLKPNVFLKLVGIENPLLKRQGTEKREIEVAKNASEKKEGAEILNAIGR